VKYAISLLLLLSSFSLCAEDKAFAPQTSELFVDLTHPKVLYANHASLALIPASVTKLFVAASALKQWGSYHTFASDIYQRGQWKQGVLIGDLVFYGQGDPAFTNEKMWQLVNNLQQLGLKKITGNLVVNTSYLGNITVSASDRIAAKHASKVSYDSLPTSAGSNFSTVGVAIMPGEKAGDLAQIKILPYQLQNVRLDGNVITASGKNNTLQLHRLSQEGKEILTLSGTIGLKSAPVILYRSVGNPNRLTGALLKAFLKQAGISLDGKIIIETTPLKKTDKQLAQVQSDSLIHCLQDMLRYSNNYIADVLTLDLQKENHTSLSSMKLSEAAKVLLATYKRVLHQSKFAKPEDIDPIFASGSGLTPSNRISASNLITLLAGMYHDQRDFSLFYGSLVVPGQQTHWHNLPTINHPWMNQVSLKTGYITVPKIVHSLAGYFRMQNGDIGAFAVLFNFPPEAQNDEGQLFNGLIKHLDSVFHHLAQV